MNALKTTIAILGLIMALTAIGGCSGSVAGFGGSSRIGILEKSASDPAKRSALAGLGTVYASARFHNESIERAAVMLAGADHNFEAIRYAGELMGKVGFHTLVLLEVAKAASQAKSELPEFRDLAELSVRKLSDSQRVIDLAAWAATVETAAQKTELRTRVLTLADTAECATVDEAIARVQATLDRLAAAGS